LRPNAARVVFASRDVYSMQFGNVPFSTCRFWRSTRATVAGSAGSTTASGFRLIWNLVTTVSFDYFVNSEGQIVRMDLGYAFRTWDDHWR
jgi:hypothetical protein